MTHDELNARLSRLKLPSNPTHNELREHRSALMEIVEQKIQLWTEDGKTDDIEKCSAWLKEMRDDIEREKLSKLDFSNVAFLYRQ